MNLTLHIPEDIAARLGATGPDLERQALGALVVEGFRAGRLNKDDLGRALGLGRGAQIDSFLGAHDLFEICWVEDCEREGAAVAQLGH